MNIFKRILVFVLVLAMCSQMAVPALAANSLGVTYSATIDKPEIIESKNDQTITVTIKTNKIVDLDSLYAQAGVPSGLELQDIKNEDIGLGDLYDVDSGIIAWFSSNAMPKSTDTIAVLTYKVPANTPAGEYVIDFEIIDITVDYGKTSWETGATVSTTLTIIECPHTNKTTTTVEATCIKDGSVTVVCDDCGETTFSDVLPATGEHKDSDEDKDHNCDTCDKKIEGHNEDTKEETTPASCTEEGKRETVTFCTECGEELGRVTIETLPAGHTWGEPSYSWAADNSTCTAARSCTVCDEGKEEENVTATAETKAPTCTEDGATTYTADFTAEWAEDQTKEVPGESATDHDWQLVDYTVNADGTHTANYVCGNDASHIKSDPAEGHTYGDNGQCVCGAGKVYKVNIADTVNGKVEADATSAAEGEVVYLSATPDYENGYDLYSLTVTDAEGKDVEIWKDYSYQYFEMPASDVTVTAVFAKPYSLYVAGVQVFDINASDVLGDGKVSYDPISNVLTLDNATVQGAANDDINAHHGAGICYYGDGDTLKIELVGTNNVTALSSTSISPVGIYVASADLIIDGTGTLNVSAFAPERTDEYGRQERCGAIELAGTGSDLTIEDGVTVNASATTEGKDGIYNTAIKAESNIVIKGNVTAKALNADNTTVGLADFSVGIYSENGSITIDGGEVTSEADEGELACGIGIGYNDNAKIEIINGAVVSAKAAEAAFSNSSGIAVQGEGQVVISDSTVTAIGGEADGAVSHGIGSCGDISITNSTVTATGGKAITTEDAGFGTSNGYSYGIGSEGKITISGGTVIATASEASASFGIGALGEVAITGSAVITATGETYGVGSEETITIGGDVTGEFTGGVMAVGALKGVDHEEGDYEITVKDELADEASKLTSIPAADWVNYDYVKIGSHTCAPTVVEETKATCIAAGNKTYYTCECGKYFADAEGKTVIPDLDTWKAEGGDGYIAIDDTAHDYPNTPSGYSDNGDGTHTAYYVCGRNESHIKYDESENHTYKDGICVCKKKQTFTVTVYNEYGQADKITLSNTTATYGEDYVTNVSSTVGTGLMVTLIKKVSEEMWTGGGYFAFDPETNTLTVDADFITEDILVEVIPYVTLTTYVNGGAVSEDWQLNYETDEDGKFTVEWYCGEESYLFTDWDETSDSFVDGANTIFVREGYTVTSYNTAADGTGTKYETGTEYTLTEDTTLYIQWECLHKDTKAEDNKDGKTHNIVCANGCVIEENVGHTYKGETHTCECGAVEILTITTVMNGGVMIVGGTVVTDTEFVLSLPYGFECEASISDVTKTGHSISGFVDQNDKSYEVGEKFTLTENMTMTIQWKANEYTVNWKIDGEEKSETLPYGADIKAPEAPAKEGHNFTGWTDGTKTYQPGDVIATVPVDGIEIELTSTWEAKTYAVKFYNGEELLEETNQVFDAAIKTPDAPVIEGHIFIGWFDADDKPMPEKVPAVENQAYYAKYEADTYTVTFAINGEEYKKADFEYGAAVTAPEYVVPEGHSFTTWTLPEKMPAEDITLDAVLTVNSYTVTFTINGEEYKKADFEYGAAVTAPAYEIPEGHSFKTWTLPEKMPAEDITLDATLTVDSYFVSFYVGKNWINEYSVEYGAKIPVPEYIVPEGHTFSGWDVPATMPAKNIRLEATLTVNSYSVTFTINGEEYKKVDFEYGAAVTAPAYEIPEGHSFTTWTLPEKMPAEDITLDATLTPNTYTVTWIVDGEEFDTTEATFGQVIALPENEPTKTGYNFTGWNTKADGTGDPLTAETVMNTTDNLTVYYAQWEVIEYTLTIEYRESKENAYIGKVEKTIEVPFGTKLSELSLIAELPDKVYEDYQYGKGVYNRGSYSFGPNVNSLTYIFNADFAELTMPAEDSYLRVGYAFTGWADYGNGFVYEIRDNCQYTGWTEISHADYLENGTGSDWYYLDPTTGYRAEGVTRVPYPEDAINGNTYAPDQESIDYAASKGKEFIDATEAWFWFDEDGKFQSDNTGFVPGEDATRYAVNGMIPWHVGMVKDENGDYYYFLGDEVNGGNIMATGDVFVSRDNTDLGAVVGGCYTFADDGKLCKCDGITDMPNGTKRYYEDAQLMLGNGLTKVGENYIYVRSNGELVVGREYWVPVNDYGIEEGMYEFDENGFIIIPEPEVLKNGVYNEDGKWIYYVDGAKQYNAGLMILPEGTNWYDAEGSVVKTADGASYVYVRSNAQLATGTYWITNTNGEMAAGKYDFDEYGLIQTQMNGIYYENGGLYLYKDNRIQYNAGLMQYSGTSSEGVVYDNAWIYVRSNGQLAIGTYWITNTNDKMDSGKYEFDENGRMKVEAGKNGIVAEGGKLYYYVDGVKQVGTGLTAYNGSYIYVKTSGELATGDYWVTNTGETGMNQGMYTFGDDGILIG